jgi:hypothetical protein
MKRGLPCLAGLRLRLGRPFLFGQAGSHPCLPEGLCHGQPGFEQVKGGSGATYQECVAWTGGMRGPPGLSWAQPLTALVWPSVPLTLWNVRKRGGSSGFHADRREPSEEATRPTPTRRRWKKEGLFIKSHDRSSLEDQSATNSGSASRQEGPLVKPKRPPAAVTLTWVVVSILWLNLSLLATSVC